MGSNGTVFFSNGQTYAYTGAVPMLTSPTEYPQSVPGMPAQPAHHPTFPAQVPQSVTPTVANGPTQVIQTKFYNFFFLFFLSATGPIDAFYHPINITQ